MRCLRRADGVEAIRVVCEHILQELIEAEATEVIGATLCEHSLTRTTWRNGDRRRPDADGSVLLVSCWVGPLATFTTTAVLVVIAYAAPGRARRIAIRRALRHCCVACSGALPLFPRPAPRERRTRSGYDGCYARPSGQWPPGDRAGRQLMAAGPPIPGHRLMANRQFIMFIAYMLFPCESHRNIRDSSRASRLPHLVSVGGQGVGVRPT
ncbi:hypothetical protein ACWEWO_42570, partial [Streptomyces humi]